MVALLRGINVGGHRVAMRDLAALFESLGCTGVRTLLASGNVVFTPPHAVVATAPKAGLGARLEAAFEQRFGFAAPTALVASALLQAVIDGNPLPLAGVNPSRLFVALPVDGDIDAVRARVAPLGAQAWAGEHLAVGAHALYLHHPEGIHDSPLARAVARATRDRLTMRNWATMLKLQAAVMPGSASSAVTGAGR